MNMVTVLMVANVTQSLGTGGGNALTRGKNEVRQKINVRTLRTYI